ncbi:MAG: methyl-accepting chemotaxis protein [Planctomycetota bacterium]|nr:MAG: methyl-accepting chemotaxis protein [Planctomycetota bacterium]
MDTRVDASQFTGSWQAIIQGINDTAEGVVVPLRDIGGVLDKLAAGDAKAQVTADYKGDYNVLKVACNALGDQINWLGQEMEKLAAAAAEGNLDFRGDPSQFKGDIAEIINGVNRTMEFVATPLKAVAKVLAAGAQKDLTHKVEGDFKGQFGDLKNNVNNMMIAVADALRQVSEAVEQVGAASGQVASASQSLAEGSQEQAASLEETSSSLEEMASMTKQNADNAQQANTLSNDAQRVANNGNKSMGRMNDAINEIQRSSDETAKIIKVIDEIAFQTNLLALNAAVEAARAGEAGKGFAVVAEEVRNLAMRSAEAAKNTTAMIDESLKNSKNGVDIAGEVSKVLEEIVTGIGKTSDLVGEIAAASQEQSQGIDQINTAMAQMDKVTQQNAANAEESASASEELNAQAEELQAMVQEFTLTNTSSRSSGATHRSHSLGQSDQTFHQIAGGSKAPKAKAKEAQKATAKAEAEKTIPMSDESSNTDDLEEFNS